MLHIRTIQPSDDAAMAMVIRRVMPEFGAVGCGFAINDPEVDWLSRAYAAARSAYFVVCDGAGTVLGGGGIAPLEGGDAATCSGFVRIDAALGATGHGGCNTFYLLAL